MIVVLDVALELVFEMSHILELF